MSVSVCIVPSQVNDISLEDYIAVKSKNAVFVPHTAGRYQKKRFRKAQCPIVERCAPTAASGQCQPLDCSKAVVFGQTCPCNAGGHLMDPAG